jgi:hypothetical protein
MCTSNIQRRWTQLLIAIGSLGCIFCTPAAMGAMSEIDAFDAAVTTQDKQIALAFIDDFPSSQLVPTLIELLRPEIAQQVCGTLPSSATSAQEVCERLHIRLTTAQDQQSPSEGASAVSGASEMAISPQAKPATQSEVLVSSTPRGSGNTDARLIPPLNAADGAASNDTNVKKHDPTEDKPKPKNGTAVTSSYGAGGDPGSGNTGGANSVTTHGKDPGSGDSASDGGSSNHDSHQ